jgi:hypothetical protein
MFSGNGVQRQGSHVCVLGGHRLQQKEVLRSSQEGRRVYAEEPRVADDPIAGLSGRAAKKTPGEGARQALDLCERERQS